MPSKPIRTFLYFLFSEYKFRTLLFLATSVLASLFDGIGLTLIIPMLSILGLEGQPSKMGQHITKALQSIHVPLELWSILLVCVLAVTATSLLNLLNATLMSDTNHMIIRDLRLKLFEHYFKAKWNFFLKNEHGRLANQLIIETERTGKAFLFFSVGVAFFIVTTIYIALAFRVNWKMALLTMGSATIISLMLRKQISRGRDFGAKVSLLSQDFIGLLNQSLGAAKIIKASSSETRLVQKIDQITFRQWKTSARGERQQLVVKSFSEIFGLIILCLCIYLSITYAELKGSELLLLLFIFLRTAPRVTELQNMTAQFFQTVPSIQSTFEILGETRAEKERVKGERIDFKKEIHLKNINFSYGDSVRLLQNIEMKIPAGRMIGFAGGSGGGKSTVLDLILGLQIPTSGDVYVDGVNLNKMDLQHWRDQIGFVSQDTFLFHDTIKKNISWYRPDASDKEIEEAVCLADCKDFIEAQPNGFNTIVGDRGIKLSGGQKQKLALARALLKKPKILILDEATSSLDLSSENLIQKSIENLKSKMTIFVVAHRLATLRDCDEIIVIDNGKIVQRGNWNTLKGENGRFLELMNYQMF